MTVEELQKRAAELKKAEFRKNHPMLGFLANDPSVNIVSETDFAKSAAAGTALRKAFGKGRTDAEIALPAAYDEAVEQFMRAEYGSAEQLRLAKHIQKLLGSRQVRG